jgi:Protein of unknown function with HXXEE motif
MDSRSRTAFAILIAAQAAHSVEEYVFRLYDVFAPARFVSSLFSSSLSTGFALANAGIVLFGIWCYLARVRPSHPSARTVGWFWVALEMGNGVGHTLLAAAGGGYFPGAWTAPVLFGVSLYLGSRLVRGTSAAALS